MTNYKYDTFECHCDKGFIGEYCEKGRLPTLFNRPVSNCAATKEQRRGSGE